MTAPVISGGVGSEASSMPRPSGAVVGDLVVQIFVSVSPGSGGYVGNVFTLPANTTVIGRTRGSSNFAPELAAGYKVLDSGDPANFSYTNALGTATLLGTFRVTGFDPANPITPIPASSNNSNTTNVIELLLGSVDNLKDGKLIVIGTRAKADDLIVSGMDETYKFNHSNATSLGMTILTLDLPNAGSSGNKLIESVSDIASRMRGLMFVINAVPDAPPPPDPDTDFTSTSIDATTDGYLLSFTADGNDTVAAVALKAGSTAPSAAQVLAGNNASDVDVTTVGGAKNSVFASASTPAQLALTGLTLPIYDVYIAVDTNKVTFAGQYKLPPSGYQYKVVNLGGGALPGTTVLPSGTVGDGSVGSDVLEISSNISPQNVAIAPTAKGGFALAERIVGRTYFSLRTYDYSAQTWATVAGVTSGDRQQWIVNNGIPYEVAQIPDQEWWTGVPIEELDLSNVYLDDPEGDPLIFEIDPPLPAGIEVYETVDQDGPRYILRGTPEDGEEGEDTYSITITDPYTDSAELTVDISVGTGATVPEVDDGETSLTDAITAIETAGLSVETIQYQESDTVQNGDVISIYPASGTRVPPGSTVYLVVAGLQYSTESAVLVNNTGTKWPEGTEVEYRIYTDGDVDSPTTRTHDSHGTGTVNADGRITLEGGSGGAFWYEIYKTNADKSLSIIFSDQGEFQ